ncbi:hypothetical protein BJY16_008665 [Actinoplanes octamycinicus]|uniref:SecDF P1 head subdomain domain-containing protein n=1 Tax=Actinoplanes octamycinicus TaxID=135948 RepID=A0A7W7H723_9ACTN|nr:hypothetical protein [Actinoplanes octamycinicus]MBB4745206.1 hypothetical protein [Actinoplanes octamycinicus]
MGTAAGLIGKIPWLGLVAGPLAVIGVIGLLIAQRAAPRPGNGTAGDRPPATTAPARRWLWGGAAVLVVAAVVVWLLVDPGPDDRPVKPGAARAPLGLYMVQAVAPGACAPTAADREYTDGGECLTVSADGGFTVQQLDRVQVRDESDQGNGWVVAVTFADPDAARFTELTGQVSARPEPGNQLAIVLDKRLLSHPVVLEKLTGGTAVVATRLTEADARALAGELGVG